MADQCPKMPAGHHRDRISLPDQPDQQGGGVQWCPQLLRPTDTESRISGPPTNNHFIQEHKSTIAPLHPITPKESPWTVWKTGERETLYLFNGLTFRFTEQSTKVPHEP